MNVDRYDPALVVLHWLLGVLIVLGLFMGTFSLERLPNTDPARIDSLRGHMINGAVIGCLAYVSKNLIQLGLASWPAGWPVEEAKEH